MLSLILALAVKDGRLVRNVAEGISLPRVLTGERRYLTPRRRTRWRPPADRTTKMMVFLSYSGVRFDEMAALRVSRVDFLRRRALIAESVTPVKGVMTWGTTTGSTW